MSPNSLHQVFDVSALDSQRAAQAKHYLEFLRVPALSAGIYTLAAGATDNQQPHHEDEIYYVLRGNSKMRVADQEFPVQPGQVIFVPAKVPHKFFDIAEELSLLVIFAPAETSAT